MNRRWYYLIEQCLSTNENSYKKVYKISREHEPRLKKCKNHNPGDANYERISF